MTVNHIEETKRMLYLEYLYQHSGRTCSTYTGLYQEHVQALIEADMAAVLNSHNA